MCNILLATDTIPHWMNLCSENKPMCRDWDTKETLDVMRTIFSIVVSQDNMLSQLNGSRFTCRKIKGGKEEGAGSSLKETCNLSI